MQIDVSIGILFLTVSTGWTDSIPCILFLYCFCRASTENNPFYENRSEILSALPPILNKRRDFEPRLSPKRPECLSVPVSGGILLWLLDRAGQVERFHRLSHPGDIFLGDTCRLTVGCG